MDVAIEEELQEADLDEMAISKLSDEDLEKSSMGEEGNENKEPSKEEGQENHDKEKDKKPELTEEEVGEKLKRQVAEKENHIRSQAQEIGKLRKEVIEKRKTFDKEALKDEIIENPSSAYNKLHEDKQLEQEEINLENEQKRVNTRLKVNQHAPDFEENISGIAEMLKKEGFPDYVLDDFKKDPYADDHFTLTQINERYKVSKNLENSQNEILGLKNEINKLKGRPGAIIDKLQRITAATPGISADTGGATGENESFGVDLTVEELSRLSDADFKRLVKASDK